MDEEGEEIHSLAVRDVSRDVTELAPEPSDIANLQIITLHSGT